MFYLLSKLLAFLAFPSDLAMLIELIGPCVAARYATCCAYPAAVIAQRANPRRTRF
jgi:hypothetical protein